MKQDKIKFIKKIVFFLILIVALILILNTFYVKTILQKKIIYKQEKSYQNFIKNNSKIDYAFFGSSNVMDGINPEYIPKSFNFATMGGNNVEIYYKLKRITEKDNIQLNTIFLPLDFHSFTALKEEDGSNLLRDLWLYSDFMSYNEIKEIRRKPILSLWIESIFPIIGNGKDFSILLTNPELAQVNKGWVQNNCSLLDLNQTEEANNRYKELFKWSEQKNQILLDFFLKTIKLANQKDINIIFIKYPLPNSFYNVLVQNNITNEEYYDSIFNYIEENIGQNYSLLDYQKIYFNNLEYFCDSDHLNQFGAEEFSKLIYKDIQNLNLTFSEKQIISLNKKEISGISIFYFLSFVLIFLEFCLLLLLLKLKN